jgi:Domain of unknown function (DUF1918)
MLEPAHVPRPKESPMDVTVGDEIIVDGRHTNDLPRKGEVLEVLTSGGVEHYRVRWDDGTDCIFFPSSDAHFEHLGARSSKR